MSEALSATLCFVPKSGFGDPLFPCKHNFPDTQFDRTIRKYQEALQ